MNPTEFGQVVTLGLSVVALAVSVVVAVRQIQLTRREHLFPVVIDLLNEFRDEEFKVQMAYIREQLPGHCYIDAAGLPQMTVEARRRVRRVVGYFNNVGILVAEGAVDVKLVAAMMGKSVVDTWETLAPIIYADRARRGSDSVLNAHFEHLVVKIEKWPPGKLRRRLGLKRRSPRSAGWTASLPLGPAPAPPPQAAQQQP